jgi:hypothetical protein
MIFFEEYIGAPPTVTGSPVDIFSWPKETLHIDPAINKMINDLICFIK